MKTAILVLLVAGSVGLLAQNNPPLRRVNPSNDLDKALMLYGEVSGRNLLRHPALAGAVFVLNNTSTNRNEIIQHVEAALAEKEIIVIPDGGKFVLVGPKSQRAQLIPGSTNVPALTTKLYPKGTVLFVNGGIWQLMTVHAELLGKKLDWSDSLPQTPPIFFKQATELTKEELLYAFETLARWQGLKLVPVGDDAVKPAPIPREPEGKPTK